MQLSKQRRNPSAYFKKVAVGHVTFPLAFTTLSPVTRSSTENSSNLLITFSAFLIELGSVLQPSGSNE